MISFSQLRRFVFGSPIRTEHAHQERLPKYLALPVFASDALSSVAYATEEILRILVLAVAVGTALGGTTPTALRFLLPITLAIGALLVIVVASYIQTIFAYPTGGGSFIVSSQNLGSVAGRIAGGSLMISYILTVSVSISAGVAATVSALQGTNYSWLIGYSVPMAVVFLVLLTWANLRGMKESGAIFALPTYSFILSVFLVLGLSLWKFEILGHVPCPPQVVPPEEILQRVAEPVTLFFILRAFSAGCTALTGVEAVSDGVAAFQKPESRNAALTLGMLAVILTAMFLGIGWFAWRFHVLPIPEESGHYQTVLSQIARTALGSGGLYIFVQVATTAVLILAANTAFADFPRVCYFMAREGFLPRQLMNIGDRLVFQNGILALSIVAGALIIWSRADTHTLMPLYATGVFVAFTLSQAGMVKWQVKHKLSAWPLRAAMNAVGALVTATVAVVIFTTKFYEGSWIVAVLLGVELVTFFLISRHYEMTRTQLAVDGYEHSPPKRVNTVLLLVPRVQRGVLQALDYARSIGLDCRAIHVNIDPDDSPRIRREWEKFGAGVPLVILESPYRSIVEPVIEYVDEALQEHPDHMITVIVPEFVPRHWWQLLLHNNVAMQLKGALGARRNVVITNVRYFLQQ